MTGVNQGHGAHHERVYWLYVVGDPKCAGLSRSDVYHQIKTLGEHRVSWLVKSGLHHCAVLYKTFDVRVVTFEVLVKSQDISRLPRQIGLQIEGLCTVVATEAAGRSTSVPLRPGPSRWQRPCTHTLHGSFSRWSWSEQPTQPLGA